MTLHGCQGIKHQVSSTDSVTGNMGGWEGWSCHTRRQTLVWVFFALNLMLYTHSAFTFSFFFEHFAEVWSFRYMALYLRVKINNHTWYFQLILLKIMPGFLMVNACLALFIWLTAKINNHNLYFQLIHMKLMWVIMNACLAGLIMWLLYMTIIDNSMHTENCYDFGLHSFKGDNWQISRLGNFNIGFWGFVFRKRYSDTLCLHIFILWLDFVSLSLTRLRLVLSLTVLGGGGGLLFCFFQDVVCFSGALHGHTAVLASLALTVPGPDTGRLCRGLLYTTAVQDEQK